MNALFLRSLPSVLIAGILGATATRTLAADAKESKGDKIDFSAPAEAMPVRPLTERDLGSRPFSFQRDSFDARSELGSPVTALPSPDQVNRTRALQELLERSAVLYSRDGGGSQDDPLRSSESSGELGIDDLYQEQERHANRLGLDTGDNDGSAAETAEARRRDGTDRDQRFGMQFDDAKRREGREDFDSGLFRPMGQESDGSAKGQFLPRFELRSNGEFSGALGERRGRDGGNNPSDLSRGGARSMFGNRDGVGTRGGEDGMSSFRRMLSNPAGGGSPVGAGLNRGGTASGTAGAVGETTLFGGTPGATRNLSEALDARGVTAPAAVDPLGNLRSPGLPSRPVDLGLNIGRDTSRPLDSERLETPAPRAMELFQKKHDTRLPSRAF